MASPSMFVTKSNKKSFRWWFKLFLENMLHASNSLYGPRIFIARWAMVSKGGKLGLKVPLTVSLPLVLVIFKAYSKHEQLKQLIVEKIKQKVRWSYLSGILTINIGVKSHFSLTSKFCFLLKMTISEISKWNAL